MLVIERKLDFLLVMPRWPTMFSGKGVSFLFNGILIYCCIARVSPTTHRVRVSDQSSKYSILTYVSSVLATQSMNTETNAKSKFLYSLFLECKTPRNKCILYHSILDCTSWVGCLVSSGAGECPLQSLSREWSPLVTEGSLYIGIGLSVVLVMFFWWNSKQYCLQLKVIITEFCYINMPKYSNVGYKTCQSKW